jgi:hypothetical protein
VESRKDRSPWAVVGMACGCLALVVLVVAVGVAFFVVSTVRDWQASIEDPERRAGAVREMLGCATLPEGYVAAIGVEIPLTMRLAVLSNVPFDEEGRTERPLERAFFYARVSDWVKKDGDIGPVFAGAGDPSRIFDKLDESNLRLRGGTPIASGTIEVAGRTIPWAAERGEVELAGHRVAGVVAAFVVRCDAGNDGLGGWIGPDPAPDFDVAEADLRGTPADPAALAAFLSRFDLCR